MKNTFGNIQIETGKMELLESPDGAACNHVERVYILTGRDDGETSECIQVTGDNGKLMLWHVPNQQWPQVTMRMREPTVVVEFVKEDDVDSLHDGRWQLHIGMHKGSIYLETKMIQKQGAPHNEV